MKPRDSTFSPDPLDLAFLIAGYTSARGQTGEDTSALTIQQAETFIHVAELLHLAWEVEEKRGDFPGVWAYAVAEPLGEWIAAQGMENDGAFPAGGAALAEQIELLIREARA